MLVDIEYYHDYYLTEYGIEEPTCDKKDVLKALKIGEERVKRWIPLFFENSCCCSISYDNDIVKQAICEYAYDYVNYDFENPQEIKQNGYESTAYLMLLNAGYLEQY